MRTLTLLRHAQAAPGDGRDIDRPLTDAGRRAAEAVGRRWRDEGAAFDHVLASPARRVRETIAAAETGYGRPLAPEWADDLYAASVDTLLAHLRALPVTAMRVLLVGHNPGLPLLAGLLTGEDLARFPTAGVAELTLPDWVGAGPGTARLVRFVNAEDR